MARRKKAPPTYVRPDESEAAPTCVLRSPSLIVLMVSVDVLELRSCVKVEVDVLGSPSPIVLMVSVCGRKATLNRRVSDLGSCVQVEVAVLGSPSPIALSLIHI